MAESPPQFDSAQKALDRLDRVQGTTTTSINNTIKIFFSIINKFNLLFQLGVVFPNQKRPTGFVWTQIFLCGFSHLDLDSDSCGWGLNTDNFTMDSSYVLDFNR